jgi:hypothetical protein
VTFPSVIFPFEIDTLVFFPYILSQKKPSAIRGLLWLMEKDAARVVKKEKNDEGG